MKTRSLLLLLSIFPLLVTTAAGQYPVPPPNGDYNYHLPGLDDSSKTKSPVPITREPRVMVKGPLALSDSDQANYAGFLAQSQTGLIRLLPRINPKSAFAYTGERPAITGDGAYFSFHYRAHAYGYGSDLELQAITEINVTAGTVVELPPHYILSVGFAGADFGMMSNIGEVSLDDLSAFDLRASYLLQYQTPRAEADARAEHDRFNKGLTVEGQTYKNSLPLQPNATYLLRSINYGVSDVLVAFQVVRQERDSSVIIAWKTLRSYPTPELVRNK